MTARGGEVEEEEEKKEEEAADVALSLMPLGCPLCGGNSPVWPKSELDGCWVPSTWKCRAIPPSYPDGSAGEFRRNSEGDIACVALCLAMRCVAGGGRGTEGDAEVCGWLRNKKDRTSRAIFGHTHTDRLTSQHLNRHNDQAPTKYGIIVHVSVSVSLSVSVSVSVLLV